MIKSILLLTVFAGCTYIGRIISGQYKKRVEELKEMKKSLLGLETKMKYTYEILPEIFIEIAKGLKPCISNIFKTAACQMQNKIAKEAWENAIETSKTNMTKEDLEILKGFGKLLGKTDMEGQVSQIELTNGFLETQIEKAEKELSKNEKLYKALGSIGRTCTCNFIDLEEEFMDINLLFKIAAIGILVAVLHQVLVRAGREDQAMMTTLAGLVIVLTMVIKEISSLFDTVRTIFNL